MSHTARQAGGKSSSFLWLPAVRHLVQAMQQDVGMCRHVGLVVARPRIASAAAAAARSATAENHARCCDGGRQRGWGSGPCDWAVLTAVSTAHHGELLTPLHHTKRSVPCCMARSGLKWRKSDGLPCGRPPALLVPCCGGSGGERRSSHRYPADQTPRLLPMMLVAEAAAAYSGRVA